MKESTKKSTKPAAKSQVKVKDMAPKKDAKGGSLKGGTQAASLTKKPGGPSAPSLHAIQ